MYSINTETWGSWIHSEKSFRFDNIMELFNVLNLFVVVTILLVTCPDEGQGYEVLDYNWPGEFYRYPVQSFNPRKRDNRKELGACPDPDYNRKDIPKTLDTKPIKDLSQPENQTNKKSYSDKIGQFDFGKRGHGVKVMYGYPATSIFWPSAL